MPTSRTRSAATCGLLLLAAACGLLGRPGFIHAADRTVVGELFSADG
ncbi:MAG: hypothetical protein IH621_05640 [Krumholzibacteria bacterium]|nr:hypothetical protein [Candidatus Krumholzibacteria bacterium]